MAQILEIGTQKIKLAKVVAKEKKNPSANPDINAVYNNAVCYVK